MHVSVDKGRETEREDGGGWRDGERGKERKRAGAERGREERGGGEGRLRDRV